MSEDNNPWNNRGKKPTELEDLIQQGIKKLFGDKKGKWGSPPGNGGGEGGDGNPAAKSNFGLILGIIMIGFVVLQSFYQIEPGERGVVLQFGKYSQTTDPGLNFLIPFVEKVTKVDVESIRKEEFGFRPAKTARGFTPSSSSLDLESLMITADNNVIQLNWVVQYRIAVPEHFLFEINEPTAAVRDISEAVIRRLIGNRDFNYVLNNRSELAESTKNEMQVLLDKYKSGIRLVTVQLQDLNPPDPVKPSFNEVNEAEQDKIRSGNEAQKERNRRIPVAEGEAKKLLEEARGYAIEVENNARGDVSRFNAIYAQYRSAKTVTRTRMYIDTMKAVLPGLQEVIVLDQDKKGSMVPLINMGGGAIPGLSPASVKK